MAINIKEVLHPTDSDSIKWGKVNYNFDQILANGGGPTGPKGEKGIQGDQGLTGLKGGKGDKGEIGLKGEVGVTDSPWGVIEHVSGDAIILKPKTSVDIDGNGTPTQYPNFAALYLGDGTYDETTNDDGINDSNARITLEKEDGIFDEYIRFRHAGNKNARITSVVDGSYTEFRLLKDLGNTNIAFKIDLDKITLLSNSDEFLIQGQQIRLKPLADTNIVFESDGAGILDIDMPVVIKDYTNFNSTSAIKVPVGNEIQRPSPVTGMLRFNNLSNRFEGYYATTWKPIDGLQDNDGDTYITVEQSANENVIRMYFGGTTPTEGLSIGTTQNDGLVNLLGSVYTARDFVSDGSIMPKTAGKGLMFPAKTHGIGGQLQSTNNAAPQARRTIHDYFYRPSINMETLVTNTSNTPFAVNYQGTTNSTQIDTTKNKLSDNLFYIHETWNATSNGTFLIDKAPVAIVINTVTSKLSYVKVGHQVTAWGKLQFWPFPVSHTTYTPTVTTYNIQGKPMGNSTSASTNARNARIMIFPADGAIWPYKNASSEKVIFPLTINMDSTFDYSSPSAYVTASDNKYYGVIFPGMAGFNIIRVEPGTMNIESTETATVPTLAGGGNQPIQNANSPYAKFLTMKDFEAAFVGAKDVTLEFNFTMATNINSYDPIIESNTRAMYTVGSPFSSM